MVRIIHRPGLSASSPGPIWSMERGPAAQGRSTSLRYRDRMKGFDRVREFAGDPFRRSIIISSALILGGFVAIGLAWHGAARSLIVAEQLPYLVSGGVGGLALIAAGAGVLAVQSSRYWNARERKQLDHLISLSSANGRAGDLEPGGGKTSAQTRSARGSTSRVKAPPK